MENEWVINYVFGRCKSVIRKYSVKHNCAVCEKQLHIGTEMDGVDGT